MKYLIVSLVLSLLGAAGFAVGSNVGVAGPDPQRSVEASVTSSNTSLLTGCSGCNASYVLVPSSGVAGPLSSCGCDVGLMITNQYGVSGGCASDCTTNETCHFRWTVDYYSTCNDTLITGSECGVQVTPSSTGSTGGTWMPAFTGNSYNPSCGAECRFIYTIAQRSGMLICVDKATLAGKTVCSHCQ